MENKILELIEEGRKNAPSIYISACVSQLGTTGA